MDKELSRWKEANNKVKNNKCQEIDEKSKTDL